MNKKIANKKIDQILWLDLEMTGLSAIEDLILEVAIIITDWDFNEISSYHGIIKNNSKFLSKQFALNSNFWDSNQQSRDNLLEQNKDGKPIKTIENEIIKFIGKNFKKNVPVLLAGNSIHIDRQFIRAKWPKFDSLLHYRMLDVSAWKVVFEGKFGKKYMKPDTHRALDDIRGSIEELKYYLDKLK